jgi:peptidoglycan/LPS O-acetylase OafA/YrhL
MSAAVRKPGASTDASVNGLRGITLLLIVMTHYVPTTFFSGNIGRPVAAVMMVVTGYFLALVLERQQIETDRPFFARLASSLSFFFQRHIRIWPAIAGIVGIYVILGYLDGGRTTTQIHTTWPMYLAYMGNVVKMIYETEAFPAHFWLISAQEQFVLFTLLVTAILGYQNMRSFLVGAVVVGVLTRLVASMLWMPDQPALATETPLAVADALALGMLVRMAIVEGASRTKLRRNYIAAILGVTMFWALMPNTYGFYFALVPLITALIGCLIIVYVTDEIRATRVESIMLAWPGLVVLGQMSLSLFLVHPLVNTLLNIGYSEMTGEILDWWLLAIVGPPLSLVVAFGYFRAVEVPLRRMRRKARGSATPVPATA